MRGTSPLDRLRRLAPSRLDHAVVPGRGSRVTTAAAAVVALAGVLRLLRLGHESLWLDEAASVSFVTREYTTLQLLLEIPLTRTNPPLYYVLLDGWVRLLGTSEVAVRLPSALLGILAVGLTFRLGSTLYDRSAGLAAASLLAVSSFHIHYSQEARAYSLLVTLTLVSYLLLVRILRHGPSRCQKRVLGGYVAATALLGYTHVYGFFVILAQNLYVVPHLLTNHEWSRLGPVRHEMLSTRSWVYLQTGVAALVSPYLVALASRARSLARGGGRHLAWVPEPGPWDLAVILRSYVVFPPGDLDIGGRISRTGLVSMAAILLVMVLAFVALYRSRDRGPRDRDRGDPILMLLLWFLTPILGGYLLSKLVTPVLQPRYTIPSSVALFLLAGAGLDQVRRLPLPSPGALTWRGIAAGLLLAAMVAPLPGYYALDQKEQWREAVHEVESSARSGALVVLSESYTVKPYRYYADRADLEVVPLDDEASPDRAEAAADGHDEAWVLLSHAREDAIVEHLASPGGNWTVVEREAYVGIQVHELLRDG